MARFPQFEDYEKRRNFDDGIKRCDELLKKSPGNPSLLTTKLRLLYATKSNNTQCVLDDLIAAQPPASDVHQLIAIEEAVVESQRNVFPPSSLAGPSVSKIWDIAVKASTSTQHKLELISVRFERAVLDNRLTDAQQALIQLKATQPKNRVVYMAHAAFTQLTSRSNEDLQARLAIGLARKAVTEKFDEDKALDVRVPGQIFALQGSGKDIESIKERPFGESKHVFDAIKRDSKVESNGTANAVSVPGPSGVPSNEWLTAEIQALKGQFASLIDANASSDTIRPFALNAMRLFHASITALSKGARRSPADACFLAVSALVRLFEQTSDPQYLLQAAYLAGTMLRHNEHIHEARLILVYLYMRLSLGSLAMKLFDSLSVKEIQHDTVGHVLFTRIALLHPQPASWAKKGTMDPLKRTAHALSMYVRHEDKLAETLASVLNHGQTGMIFDLQELRESLRTSTARRITLLEHRRIARLTRGHVGDDEAARAVGPLVTENWLQTKDNRDFSAAFNYGLSVEEVLHNRNGGRPSIMWLLYMLAADTAWSIAYESAPLVHDAETLLQRIQEMKAEVDLQQSTDLAPRVGLTPAEYLAGEVGYCALQLLLAADSKDEDKAQQLIAATASACEALNMEELVQTNDPLAERLLDHYAYADALRIIISGYKYLHEQGFSVALEPLKDLESLARRLFVALQRHATEQQARVKATTVRQAMSQDEEVWKGLQAFGAETLDGFCEDVAKSAREGWEGLSKIILV